MAENERLVANCPEMADLAAWMAAIRRDALPGFDYLNGLEKDQDSAVAGLPLP